MAAYTKESLEALRQKIDLVDVLGAHIDFKKAGASYKALCPFHDERTPSFMIHKGDTHYHCFGCGAHGDAIAFLMQHQKLTFSQAVENLAQRFHVQLEMVEGGREKKGTSKTHLKEALEQAALFYHFCLLHTAEGHEALSYLYGRGLNLDFIRTFHIGLAPRGAGLLRKVLHGKFISDETLQEVGLIAPGKEGGWRDFFSDRITFPVRDAAGGVIGFSARKYKEETFGGKYVNTPETPLFKKSRILFGLNYCRRRIAKERKVIIVEGQIDALRLIQEGLNLTVAGQGTAFGEGHVKELLGLGISAAYLALDSDDAGQEAALKIGDFFQREGIEVRVVKLPPGSDPDSYLRARGVEAFRELLHESQDYLSFLVARESRKVNMESPAGKSALVQQLARRIREWEQPLLVYESLRRLAQLTHTPESMIGVDQEHMPNLYIKKSGTVGTHSIDPDRVLETDFLKWLLEMGVTRPLFIEWAESHISPHALKVPICQQFYETYLAGSRDTIALLSQLDEEEGQKLLGELLQKKVNKEKAEQQFQEAIQQILKRNWMNLLEEIKIKIQSGIESDDEALALSKQFAEVRSQPPVFNFG